MRNDWRVSTWGEEISLEYGKRLQGYKDGVGDYVVFGSNGPVGHTTKPLAPGPGVILGRKGVNRGVEFSKKPFFVIDTAYYVKPKSKLNMRWIYFAIKYYNLGEINDGSPIPSTTRAAVYIQKLQIPDIDEQEKIARILGSLDDKIELNHQMTETLESMPQTLFKSWFVDFDPVIDNTLEAGNKIPDSLKVRADIRQSLDDDRKPLPEDIRKLFPSDFEYNEEMGWIPEGWEVTVLKKLTTKIGSGATPRGGQKVYQDVGTALIRSQNVYDSSFVWEGLARISEDAASQLSSVIVKEEDVLLNITGASILRTCVVIPEVLPARVNQHVAIIRAKQGIPSRYLHLHLLNQRTKDYLMGCNAGASREAVTKGHIESVPTIKPSSHLLNLFQHFTEPIYAKLNKVEAEMRTLASIRDTLLPQLISGELRIPDAEKLVEEAL